MSTRRRSARAMALTVLVGAALSLTAPSASAETPADVCRAFPHRQTYAAQSGIFRAPAWHYDKTVTIVYDAGSCTATPSGGDNFTLSIAGTADIYEGTSASGKLLEKRSFTSVIRSDATDGKLGWPIRWWACFDGSFSYVWTIEDVYTFAMTATDGRWVMAQRDPGSNEASGTVINACSRR